MVHAHRIGNTVAALLNTKTARQVTCIVDARLSIVATKRHKTRADAQRVEVVVTIGRPNFKSRALIRAAKRAGEPFPIKKLQYEHTKPRKR